MSVRHVLAKTRELKKAGFLTPEEQECCNSHLIPFLTDEIGFRQWENSTKKHAGSRSAEENALQFKNHSDFIGQLRGSLTALRRIAK